jgi:hypothetical protein
MDFGLPIGELSALLAMLLGGGLIMGLLAGLLGIGGGGIMVPILYELFSAIGVDDAVLMHLCVGTSLAVIIPTSLRSFFSHKAKGAVDMDIIRSMVLPVIAGVVIGTLVARYANSTILTAIWVGAATMMSLKMFFGRESWKLGDDIPGNPGRALYGLFIGTISTPMSIGGGFCHHDDDALWPTHSSGGGHIIGLRPDDRHSRHAWLRLGREGGGWCAAGLARLCLSSERSYQCASQRACRALGCANGAWHLTAQARAFLRHLPCTGSAAVFLDIGVGKIQRRLLFA